jgi:hypothetical protein
MVNNGLKSPDVTVDNGHRRARMAFRLQTERIFATKAALTKRAGRSEVVLAQAILGLLRWVGGTSCRGELRNRAGLRFVWPLDGIGSSPHSPRQKFEDSFIGRGLSYAGTTYILLGIRGRAGPDRRRRLAGSPIRH